MIGWWAWTAMAAPFLQLPDDADPGWASAAALADFELGPCVHRPCARVVDGRVEVLTGNGSVLIVEGLSPESALAVAASHLALDGIAPRPTREPEPSEPSGRSTPPADAHPRDARPPAPLPDGDPLDADPPDGPPASTSAPTAPRRSPAPPSMPTRSMHTQLPAVRGPSPSLRPESATDWWAAAWAGAGGGVLLGAQVGGRRGPAWLGAGVRVDGSWTADLGGGADLRVGRVVVRAGGWFGVETWPAECLACTVDVRREGDVEEVRVASPFQLPGAVVGPGFVARPELQVGMQVARGLVVAPRAAVALGRLPARPELSLVVQVSGIE
ncbi:MAG: hypothetical protein AAF602_16595 [Myxococcota bacterium]